MSEVETTNAVEPGPRPAARPARSDERRLRLAFLVSTVGDWIYRFALPLLVLDLTGSAATTAMTYVIEFIPYVLIGLVAGNVADRADRRRLLILCDVCSMVLISVIAVLAASGHPPLILLYAVALLLSSVRPFYFPAFQGFIVERVPGPRRSLVNAWVQGTDSTLSLLGPVVGIAVVVWMGPGVACAVNAVSFALSACLIASTRPGARVRRWARDAFANVRADLVVGLRVLTRNGPLLWGTILMTVTNFALMSIEANLAYLVIGPDGASGAGLGLVFAAQGAGSLLGASAVPALMRRVHVGRLLVTGMCLLAAAMAVPAVVGGYPALVVAWSIVGLGTSLIVVPWFTYRQDIVAPDVIGRVTSVSRAVSYLTMPVGALVGSWVLTGAGARELFLVAAACQAVVWIGTVLSPLAGARHERA